MDCCCCDLVAATILRVLGHIRKRYKLQTFLGQHPQHPNPLMSLQHTLPVFSSFKHWYVYITPRV